MAAPDIRELLACVALEPGLGGVLFVDLDPRPLYRYAEILARTVEAVDGRCPRVAVLTAGTADEDLWPHLAPVAGDTGPRLAWRPGLLAETEQQPEPVVVIPDLARAGTALIRAAVAVVGADVVHVERQGVSQIWPRAGRWLAACARRDLAALSPHLLDRFPVRWDGTLPSAPPTPDPPDPFVAPRGATRPRVPDDVVDLVLDATTGRASVRRDLALARTARAVAERRGASVVTPDDMLRAATLVGLPRPGTTPPAVPRPSEPVADRPSAVDTETADDLIEPAGAMVADVADGIEEDILLVEAPTTTTVGASAPVGPVDPLRPEDDPDALPENRSLQWAASGVSPAGRAAGVVIGHERSSDLRDLAVIPTVFRSVWRTRSVPDAEPGRITVRRQDLRRHRRRRGARNALVLVLDHTSRRTWDCAPGLAPHLRWAYDQLAAVSVVEFGHRSAADELRPERYRVRSIADPRIAISLNRLPGGASPLAAAIDLAADELRRYMHRGWASVRGARLVVVTDGRGNVPLLATAERQVTGRVTREGIDDALAAAEAVASLHRVETSVIAPVDDQYPDLTQELATALGGALFHVVDDPAAYGTDR